MAQQKPQTKLQQTDTDDDFVKYQKRVEEFEKQIATDLPLLTNRITHERWQDFRDEVSNHMRSCYPLLHGGVLSLAHNFLQIKRKYGSSVEKKVYETMTLTQFFHRLATKRAVVFYQSYDAYLLRDGYNDNGHWELVGTDHENDKVDAYDKPEKKPKLAHYLSYDELLISAMCGISSATHCINNGDRRNCGRIVDKTFGKGAQFAFPRSAIYMGLVGARFEKPRYMEYSLMIVDDTQNTAGNGYGPKAPQKQADDNEGKNDSKNDEEEHHKMQVEMDMKSVDDLYATLDDKTKSTVIWKAFLQFYNRPHLPTFEEIATLNEKERARYSEKNTWGPPQYLDLQMFKQRIRTSMELFLFDADHRAEQNKTTAYAYIVGLGTGVWAFQKSVQDRLIVEICKEIVEQTHLPHIEVLYFAWMHAQCMNKSAAHQDEGDEECMFDSEVVSKTANKNDQGKEKEKEKEKEERKRYFVHDKSKQHKIMVEFGRRAPFEALEEPFTKCLTVAMYAWDSNAFPGNEFYHGMLSASGDPAAASCSTIPYVQNSEINQEYISGENTRIYFYDTQTAKYSFHALKEIDFANDPKFEKGKQEWLRKSVASIPYNRDEL